MNQELTPSNTESAIFARFFVARQDELSSGAAKFLLSFRFDDADIARVKQLNELANEGELSPDEEAELDRYIRVGNLIAVIQAQARRSLKNPIAESATH